MKNLFAFFLAVLVSMALAAQSSLNCDFTVNAKACVNQTLVVTYTGGVSANATYIWHFPDAVVLSGTGQGPYQVKYETAGQKQITLTINWENQTCTATRNVVVITHPALFQMTGGGVLVPGGTGVEVGLSGSETGVIYKLRREGVYVGSNIPGTGSALSFGLQTVAGNYTAVGKVDGSDCMSEMGGVAVVTGSLPPASVPICMVTFDTVFSMNKVIWHKPAGLTLSHVNIYRETYVNNQFTKIGEALWSGPAYYLDSTSNPLIKPDKFKISVTDQSGTESEKSPFHKTIHLNVNPGVLGFNLIWNHYEGMEFFTYKIHRKHENGPWQVIDSIASNISSYTDIYTTSGLMYYYIEVVKPVPCNQLDGSSEESVISNIVFSRPLGISAQSLQGVYIYPNPARDFLMIKLPGYQDFTVEILTPDGRIIVENMVQNKDNQRISLSGLSAGLYLVRISCNKGTVVAKLVKE